MKSSKSIFALVYLCCSYFFALFFMSFVFHTYFHWVGSDQEFSSFFKENALTYFKVGGIGFAAGLVIWFFVIVRLDGLLRLAGDDLFTLRSLMMRFIISAQT